MAKYAVLQPLPKIEAVPSGAARLKHGATAATPVGCGGCHFNGRKRSSAILLLRAQSPAYLAATICQFRSGARANSHGMADLLRRSTRATSRRSRRI